jgi:hypothetical protein
VAPQLRFPNGGIQYSCRRFPTFWNVLTEMTGLSRIFHRIRLLNGWKMGDFDHKMERDVDQPAGAALMVKKDLLEGLGGLDERFPMFSVMLICASVSKIWGRRLFSAQMRLSLTKAGARFWGDAPHLSQALTCLSFDTF